MNDQQAIERYRYMLRTAPPDDVERAHEEAFAKLSPEQRAVVLQQLAGHVPASDVNRNESEGARIGPRPAPRCASPGLMERTFGGAGAPGLEIDVPRHAGGRVRRALDRQHELYDDARLRRAGGQRQRPEIAGADAWGDFGGDLGGGGFGGGDVGGGDFGGRARWRRRC